MQVCLCLHTWHIINCICLVNTAAQVSATWGAGRLLGKYVRGQCQLLDHPFLTSMSTDVEHGCTAFVGGGLECTRANGADWDTAI